MKLTVFFITKLGKKKIKMLHSIKCLEVHCVEFGSLFSSCFYAYISLLVRFTPII